MTASFWPAHQHRSPGPRSHAHPSALGLDKRIGFSFKTPGTEGTTEGQFGGGQGVVGHGHDDWMSGVVVPERSYPCHSHQTGQGGARRLQGDHEGGPDYVDPKDGWIEVTAGHRGGDELLDQVVENVGLRGGLSGRDGVLDEVEQGAGGGRDVDGQHRLDVGPKVEVVELFEECLGADYPKVAKLACHVFHHWGIWLKSGTADTRSDS